jgi:hypothetical protein
MTTNIEDLFPGLRDSQFDLKSPPDDLYNCIAWAAGPTNTKLWWWPFGEPEKTFWPASVPRQETLDAFRQLFETLGYSVCDHPDVEPGSEKVALFADNHGFPLHAARQLAGGRWTSKLGALEDIEHALQDLVGSEYGSVVLVMKRPWASQAEPSASPSVP